MLSRLVALLFAMACAPTTFIVAQSLETDAAPAKAPTIETSGGLAADSAWTNEDVSFWVRIQNHDATPLTSIRFQPVGDDVTITAVCTPARESAERPVCTPGGPVEVPAGGERVFNGTLRVKAGGAHQLTLLALSGTHEISVPLGAFRARDVWAALNDLKDFVAWPLLVGIVGYFYKEWASERQAAQAKADQDLAAERAKVEKQLAEDRAQAQRLAAEHAETVRIMLPIVHNYAVRYYAAIAAAYQQFHLYGGEYVKCRTENRPDDADEALKSATFSFLKLHQTTRQLGLQVGAFYLTAVLAEQILRSARDLWDTALFPKDNDRAVEADVAVTAMLDLLQRRPASAPDRSAEPEREAGEVASRMLNQYKLDEFLRTLSDSEQAVYHRLRSWLGEWAFAVTPAEPNPFGYVWVCGAVMEHETNKLFEQWYGALQPFRELNRKEIAGYARECAQICETLGALKPLGRAYFFGEETVPGAT